MPINEVFPNPTVKQVIFQIRFPNLFYIESKIGDLQMRIMEEFPESSMAVRRQVVVADLGPDVRIQDVSETTSPDGAKKIWQFASPKNFKLNILNNSLDITSAYHKTYDNPASENKFRDIIQFVLDRFFDVMKVPIINRVGLRYIDECPLPDKNNRTYTDYYDTSFNLGKFNIEEADEMLFRTVVKRGNYFLTYMESLQQRDGQHVVILDFDAFATNIRFEECLATTDALHELAIDEYDRTIKDPVREHMRRRD